MRTIQLILEGVKLSMSPRPYRLGQRQVTSEQTRARILTAARELLTASDGFNGFSIDAVARQADVDARLDGLDLGRPFYVPQNVR